MRLELKNIKHMASLSEETYCFTASLYLDGKRVAEVSNRGHGGADDCRFSDKAAEAKVYAAYSGSELESWCSEQITNWLNLKLIKRECKKHIVGIHDGKDIVFSAPPSELPRLRAKIEKQRPGILILNGLPDAELLAAVKMLPESES